MTKTMSIRMDQDNYEFLSKLTEEDQSDLSKAVRDLVTRGQGFACCRKIPRGRGFSRQGC